MEAERRKNYRCALSQCVKLSYAHEDFIDAEMVNISIGGILCSTESAVSEHERIFFMFDVPVDQTLSTVKVEGTIIHLQEQDGKTFFGVMFTDFFPGSKELLQKYLDQCNGN